MSEIKLRDYQERTKNKVVEWLINKRGNGLVALPTASGKSFSLAAVIKEILCNHNPRAKWLVVTFSKELVDNNEKAMIAYWKTAPTAVYCASLKRKEIGQVTFATIGSIAKQWQKLGKIDYIMIDEVHAVSHDDKTMFRKLIANLTEANPEVQVIGWTASPYRLGGGCLTDDHIFEDFIVDATTFEAFDWFFRNNYLSELKTKRTITQIDTSGVKMSHGDFNQKELEDRVNVEEVTRAALAEAVEMGKDRRKWLIFSTGIEHAENISNMLNDEFGIPTTFVHSKMPDVTRDERIYDFIHTTKYRACVNNLILTTGVDIKETDFIILLQPTASPARFVQVIGRGLRIAPKEGMPLDTASQRLAAIKAGVKPNGCLVGDFCGNTARNGAINDIIKPRKKGEGGGGTPPVKTCPICATINHPTVRYCPDCGYEFVFEVKITHKASTHEVVASAPRTKIVYNGEDTWFDVYDVTYAKHFSKASGKYSLKITYQCGYSSYSEYKSFEGRAYGATVSWWYKRCNGYAPKTLDDVMQYVAQLVKPTKVLVGRNGKFDNIKNYELPEEKPYIEEVVNVIN